MIVDDTVTIIGRSTAINVGNFICKVNSVKKGILIGGLHSLIYDLTHYGTWARMPEKNDVIAQVEYFKNMDKDTRLNAHGNLCKMLNMYGDKNMQLTEIVSEVCVLLKKDNVICDYQML